MKQSKDAPVVPKKKGFLPRLKKAARIVGQVSAIVLTLPLKLPYKVIQLAQYLDVFAGLVKGLGKGKHEQP